MEILLEILKVFFVAVFGLCFGSFLNVVIYRLPLGMNLAHPASHCPNCGYTLKWYDNIPVFSYLFLGCKCRNCKEPISPRYMIVELLTGSLFLLSYYRFGFNILFILSVIIIMCFICIFFIDLEHYIIPDSLNIIIGIVGIISLFFGNITYGRFNIDYKSKLFGLLIGVIILLLVLLFEKIFKKEIMGGGDIKLIMATGLFLGWQLTLLGIILGSIVAVIIEIPLSFNKKLRQNHVLPFGPYLVTGFILSLFFGLQLLESYLGLFGI